MLKRVVFRWDTNPIKIRISIEHNAGTICSEWAWLPVFLRTMKGYTMRRRKHSRNSQPSQLPQENSTQWRPMIFQRITDPQDHGFQYVYIDLYEMEYIYILYWGIILKSMGTPGAAQQLALATWMVVENG
jgi:hypothetical protein